MKIHVRNVLILGALFFSTGANAQQKGYIETLNTPVKWVDSVFRKLNRNEKIAQMFFVRAHTNFTKKYEDSVAKVIRRERLGGVVFFQGGPGRQAILGNKYQEEARVPMLMTSDGEWGLGMRLDSTVSFPYQMTLGAIQDDNLIYKMGLQVARDYRRLGMHMNLAPVVDINNNPKNPVINYRSFGENKYNVAKKGGAYVKGMQDGGLLVSIKHFPGHGDTDVDSHYDLPQLNFTPERLDSLELYPFRELATQGVSGVMIAHMNIPALDNTPKLPSTLSKPIVTDLLKQKIGFKGLIISDAMEMKGVVKYFTNGEADVRAVIAGNDILELSENSKRAVQLIRKAIRQNRLTIAQIDASVKKILTAKYWAGLNNYKPVSEQNVAADVNTAESLALQQELANAAVTILRGKDFIKSLNPSTRTILVSIGPTGPSVFQHQLGSHFTNVAYLNLANTASAKDIANLMVQTGATDQVIIGIHDTRARPGNNIPLSADILQYIKEMSQKNAVFALFGNPYNLAALKGLENAKGLIVAYQKEDFMQKAVAYVFKNQLNATGKLPVSVAPFYKFGDGQ